MSYLERVVLLWRSKMHYSEHLGHTEWNLSIRTLSGPALHLDPVREGGGGEGREGGRESGREGESQGGRERVREGG